MSTNTRPNVPVLILGGSGEGKTSSTSIVFDKATGKVSHMGLPLDEVIFMNIEDKEMPTRKKKTNVKNEIVIDNYLQYHYIVQTLDEIYRFQKAKNTKAYQAKVNEFFKTTGIDVRNKRFVVIDSFSALADLIQTYAIAKFSGYNAWNQHNEFIKGALKLVKKIPQQVFAFALPEQKPEQLGDNKLYAKIKGQELKYGTIESNFTIVLATNPTYDDVTGKMINCTFDFEPNKKNTAKAPPGLFLDNLPNDLWEVYVSIREFIYGEVVPKWWTNEDVDKAEEEYAKMMEAKKKRRASLRD